LYPVQGAINAPWSLKDQSLPTATDSFGDGRLRVYALGFGAGRYETVLTALIGPPCLLRREWPLRVVQVFTWTLDSGHWQGRFATERIPFLLKNSSLQLPRVYQYVPGWRSSHRDGQGHPHLRSPRAKSRSRTWASSTTEA